MILHAGKESTRRSGGRSPLINGVRKEWKEKEEHTLAMLLHPLLISFFSCCCCAVADATSRITGEYVVHDTRQMSCDETMGAFEGAASRYMDEMNYLVLQNRPDRSVAVQTSYSEETNAGYRRECEAANWAWTEVTAAMYCRVEWTSDDGVEWISDEGVDNCMNETDIFIRNGACFPRNEECDHYVQNPIDWQIDMQKLYGGLTCTIQDMNETYSSLIANKKTPSSVLENQGSFIDWSGQYHKAKRHQCQEAINSIFSNEKHELYHTGIELFQVFPVLIQKEYYAGDVDGIIRYEQYCRDTADGSRLDVWNGTMDCLGVGSNNLDMKQTIVIENVAECFPPTDACRSYTGETWTLDTMMDSGYSCTVRGKIEGGISKDKGEEGKIQPKESNAKDGEIDGSGKENITEEKIQYGHDVDKNEGKDAGDEKMLSGVVTASSASDDAVDEGNNHLNFRAVVRVAGLVILALTALLSIRLRIHSREASTTIGGNAATYHNPEMTSTTLEMT